MTANDSKSDVSYLNKLVEQYNNTYHYSINKNPINDDYCPSTKTSWDKAPKFKVMMKSHNY